MLEENSSFESSNSLLGMRLIKVELQRNSPHDLSETLRTGLLLRQVKSASEPSNAYHWFLLPLALRGESRCEILCLAQEHNSGQALQPRPPNPESNILSIKKNIFRGSYWSMPSTIVTFMHCLPYLDFAKPFSLLRHCASFWSLLRINCRH